MTEGASPAKETLTACLEEMEELSTQLHKTLLSKLCGTAQEEAKEPTAGGIEGMAERARNRLRACAQLVVTL